ncbi:MAG: hypothetical protein ABIS84_00070 [Arachnia sp.]
MKRRLRLLAASVAVAVAASLAWVAPANADVPPVKRVSCPSVKELNVAKPPHLFAPRPLVKLTSTPGSCHYYVDGTADLALSFEFLDGLSTPQQAEDQIREGWPAGYPYPFQPQPVPALGPGAFYWADASPSTFYWQFSPGAVAVLGPLAGGAELAQIAKMFRPMLEVYTIPGERTVNGRQWRTVCEDYSATQRCRTDIFATVIRKTPTGYVKVNGWAFNSLTYRWSDRALWKTNPLGNTGSWTSVEGRKWRTECDTARTGRGACRSYLLTTVIDFKGGKFTQADEWVFNNQVLFTD